MTPVGRAVFSAKNPARYPRSRIVAEFFNPFSFDRCESHGNDGHLVVEARIERADDVRNGLPLIFLHVEKHQIRFTLGAVLRDLVHQHASNIVESD